MIWVINMNTNKCDIYDYQKKPVKLTLVKEISHPENKLRDIELTSSKPGHYKSRTSTHGAYSQDTDPKDIKIDSFTREIAKELDHGRTTNSYDKIIIIAPPHVSGMISQHLDKKVKSLIYKNIHKDLQHLKDHELLDFLKVNAIFQDD